MAEQMALTEAERLGRALQVRRVGLGLKRPELARRADLSYPYVSEIENGMKTPSTRALRQIAAALELSPAELLELADNAQPPSGRDPESGGIHPLVGEGRGRADTTDLVSPDSVERTGLPSRLGGAGGSLDRETQLLIATTVRAELAAWVRSELPDLLRRALEQAMNERNG